MLYTKNVCIIVALGFEILSIGRNLLQLLFV